MKAYLFLSALTLCAMFAFVGYWASIPLVYFSHSTGECVQVIGEGSCESLPKRYEHLWVE